MTGDGVNDVLALKRSDLGIAMGSGAPATRAVAQIVLMNNKWSTLPQIVFEGRRVLGNIERVSDVFLTKSIYAMIISLATGVFGVAFPFQPIQLTLVSSLTIGIPGILPGPHAQYRPFPSGILPPRSAVRGSGWVHLRGHGVHMLLDPVAENR